MNSDVPGIEACKRLDKVWPFDWHSGGRAWSRDPHMPDDEQHWWLVKGRDCLNDAARGYDLVRAPTIGEMLAEIRRRGWYARIDTDGNSEIRGPVLFLAKTSVENEPADALANALAESLEKERERP